MVHSHIHYPPFLHLTIPKNHQNASYLNPVVDVHYLHPLAPSSHLFNFKFLLRFPSVFLANFFLLSYHMSPFLSQINAVGLNIGFHLRNPSQHYPVDFQTASINSTKRGDIFLKDPQILSVHLQILFCFFPSSQFLPSTRTPNYFPTLFLLKKVYTILQKILWTPM